jgi:hypothetical protein
MVAFQYRFVTTIDDLLDADAIDRAQQPAQIYRWVVDRARQLEGTPRLVIGGLLAVGLLIFVMAATRGDQLAIATVALLFLGYHFVVAPRRARARIRAQSPAQQTIQLEFGREGVSVDLENTGPVRRTWDEFTRAADTTRGVLLYFRTMKLLMPRRVFASEEERRQFVSYVKQFEPADTPL